MNWDKRFLGLAEHVAAWSKDPSTRCGAVITRGREIVSMGYNGFARGVADLEERYRDRQTKYAMIVHAEMNAVLHARQCLSGCTLYTWPFGPCSACAACVIQAGIARVVHPEPTAEQLSRWGDSFRLAATQFREAGVLCQTA